MSYKQNIPLTKIIFIGDSGVGKTCLLARETQGIYTQRYATTIVCDFFTKIYDLGSCKLKAQFWDTAGQQRFGMISKIYYKNAKAALLCLSLASRKSFENLDKWIKELTQQKVSLDNIYLIGYKSDLNIQIPTDQIILYAQSKNITYFQTSSLTGEGVYEAFAKIMKNCAQKQKEMDNNEYNNTQSNIIIEENKAPVHNKCC